MHKKNKYNSLEDAALLELYHKTACKEIVGVLFKRYTAFVFAVSMKYLKDESSSKDASMEVFTSLFDKLLQHKINHFKSWLYTVTKNHCLHIIRKDKLSTSYSWDDNKNPSDVMENSAFLYPDKDELMNKRLNNLESAIKTLNEGQRTCIELFYLKGKSYEEVSRETGYNLKKVKSYIQNGKRNLKNQLKQSHE